MVRPTSGLMPSYRLPRQTVAGVKSPSPESTSGLSHDIRYEIVNEVQSVMGSTEGRLFRFQSDSERRLEKSMKAMVTKLETKLDKNTINMDLKMDVKLDKVYWKLIGTIVAVISFLLAAGFELACPWHSVQHASDTNK